MTECIHVKGKRTKRIWIASAFIFVLFLASMASVPLTHQKPYDSSAVNGMEKPSINIVTDVFYFQSNSASSANTGVGIPSVNPETGGSLSPTERSLDPAYVNESVDPTAYYYTEPAPMGIADYGLSTGSGSLYNSYSYSTSMFMGKADISSLSTLTSSGSSEMTFQLNVNLVFYDSGIEYVYWIQDVAFVVTASPQAIEFIDNVWNMSSPSASMLSSSIAGNGTVAQSGSTGYYYSIASYNLPGNDIYISLPTTADFKVISGVTAANQPTVAFEYNDGYGWVTYDNTVFRFVSDLTSYPEFLVDGSSYNPYGTFYDAEFILGGPGGGSDTTDYGSDVNLQLEYWNGNNFQMITNAFDFGSDTAEGIENVYPTADYYTSTGSLFFNMEAGYGTLGQLYNYQDVGILDFTTQLSSGTLMVGSDSHSFSGGSAVLTLAPGTYNLYLYSTQGSGMLLWSTQVTVTAGQTVSVASPAIYTITFHESGLPLGTKWSVVLGSDTLSSEGSAIQYYVTDGAYSFSVPGVSGYESTTYSGTVTVNGGDQTVDMTWEQALYAVTFSESDLPPGTVWYVNVTGLQQSGPLAGQSYSIMVPNGSYSYVASTSDKNYRPSYDGSFTVKGSPLSEAIAYLEVTFAVTFTQSTLPQGIGWYVNISGQSSSGQIESQSYTADLMNGTYTYTVASSNRIYSPSQYAGSVSVNGAPVPVQLSFSLVTYKVTFSETGLPSAAPWWVNLTGQQSSGPIYGSLYSVVLDNGTYAYTISTSDKEYAPESYGGSLTVSGPPEFQTDIAFKLMTYPMVFTETGLNAGIWYVNMSGNSESAVAGMALTYTLPNGTYSYSVSTSDKIFHPSWYTASVSVNGATSRSIPFEETLYPVEFSETGLPQYEAWYVNVSASPFSGAISGTSYTVYLSNGSYSYAISTVDKVYGALYNGSFTVNGSLGMVKVTFSKVLYSVTFAESGLPVGSEWYVNISGMASSGPITTGKYVVGLSNASYEYFVQTSDKIFQPSYKSSLTVNGSATVSLITFSEVTYTVSFLQSGLPSGTTWYVNLSNGRTFSSSTGTISFTESNGTYSYTTATTNKTYEPTPSSGSYTVNGASVSKSVVFSLVKYTVTFTETGLSSGTTWYVNGSGISDHELSPTNISFNLANGTYSFIVTNLSSYYTTTVHFTVVINGKNVTETVDYYHWAYITGNVSPANATVTINGQAVSLSSSGAFNVSVANGAYHVAASIPGYTSYYNNFTLNSGNAKNLTIDLKTVSKPSTISSTEMYAIIGAVVAIAVIGSAVALTRKRK
jgi:hypothetical protein